MNRGLPSEETARGYPERAEFVLELPSDLRLIEAAVTYLVNRCRSYDFGGSRLSLNFRVGITEALANAVLYGNGGDPAKYVRVEVSLDESRVALCVADEGHGFDPALVPDPTLPENLQRGGGRGLFLIRQLMDEVEFSDRGNVVRLVLLRESPPARRTAGE
ncbi:MAG TPA: ATP-binding protein [Longimicrobiaceae bacterium]